jgi:hypothetical protein
MSSGPKHRAPRPADAPGVPLARLGFGVGLIAPLCVGLDAPVPIRTVTVLAFLVLVPGAAVMSHFSAIDVVTLGALTLVISLAAFAAVSAAMVWAHFWHPMLGLCGLAAVSLVALAPRLAPGRRGGRATG